VCTTTNSRTARASCCVALCCVAGVTTALCSRCNNCVVLRCTVHHMHDDPYHDVEGQQAVGCFAARHASLLVLLAGELACAENLCGGGAVGGIGALRLAGAVEGAVVTVLVAADHGFR
jgi:hypothetical protein